jgi:hypothetical protein
LQLIINNKQDKVDRDERAAPKATDALITGPRCNLRSDRLISEWPRKVPLEPNEPATGAFSRYAATLAPAAQQGARFWTTAHKPRGQSNALKPAGALAACIWAWAGSCARQLFFAHLAPSATKPAFSAILLGATATMATVSGSFSISDATIVAETR